MVNLSLRNEKIWGALCGVGAFIIYMMCQTDGDPRAPHFRHDELTIIRADGHRIPLHIEVAESQGQQAYGLMYRDKLAHDAGMLFPEPYDHIANFWMKNTFIPLDMLFIRHDGVIAKIVVNVQPLDLHPVSSDEPVRAVLEINGGDAHELGIKTGDKIEFLGLGDNK